MLWEWNRCSLSRGNDVTTHPASRCSTRANLLFPAYFHRNPSSFTVFLKTVLQPLNLILSLNFGNSLKTVADVFFARKYSLILRRITHLPQQSAPACHTFQHFVCLPACTKRISYASCFLSFPKLQSPFQPSFALSRAVFCRPSGLAWPDHLTRHAKGRPPATLASPSEKYFMAAINRTASRKCLPAISHLWFRALWSQEQRSSHINPLQHNTAPFWCRHCIDTRSFKIQPLLTPGNFSQIFLGRSWWRR
jgi:hypothetical protein